jgi:GNAT superfamily N-acetyltransferase
MPTQHLVSELKNEFSDALLCVSGSRPDIVEMSDENLFVGVVKTRIFQTQATVEGIFVKKSCQRKGIGRRYVDALVRTCKKTGITSIRCTPVSDTSDTLNGHAFWNAMGFAPSQVPGVWEKRV